MFDIGMSELMLVAVVALVAIGPKDLPRTLRAMGRMVGKVRGLAGDFNRHVDDMLREADLQEVRQKMQSVSGKGLGQTIEETIDPDGAIKRGFELPDINTIGQSAAASHDGKDDDEPIGAEKKSPPTESTPHITPPSAPAKQGTEEGAGF